MPASALRDLRSIPQSKRDKLPKGDFAGPHQSYPIAKPEDVAAAAKLVGKADDPEAVRRKIIAIAKRKGAAFVAKLPKAWTEQKASKPFEDIFTGLITLSDVVAGQARTSWIQLFKTGKFWDPRYGTFSITTQDLGEMLENFKTITPEPPTRLPIDYNHGTSRPESAEQGKAAGWLTDLAIRAGGAQLWGLVEWTDPAAEMIAAKEYQFVSPTFAYNHMHSNGEEIGTTLLAAAITNRPVLEGMEPLTLSSPSALRLADATELDGGADEAAEAMFSFDEQRRRVQAALSEAFGVVYGFGDCGPCSGCYLVDLFDGLAVYREFDGDLYQVPFHIDTDGDVHFTDRPVEVRVAYAPLTASGEQQMATIKAKDTKGNEIELSEDTVRELAKQHAPAPAAAAPGVDLAKFTELSAKVDEQTAKILDLSTKNLALEKDAKDRDAKTRVEKLVAAGKIAPADRDDTIKLALDSPSAFDLYEKQMAKRPAVVEYGRSTGSSDDSGVGSASDEAIALSRTEQEKDTKLSSVDALDRVFRKNPDLYRRYTAETAVKV